MSERFWHGKCLGYGELARNRFNGVPYCTRCGFSLDIDEQKGLGLITAEERKPLSKENKPYPINKEIQRIEDR